MMRKSMFLIIMIFLTVMMSGCAGYSADIGYDRYPHYSFYGYPYGDYDDGNLYYPHHYHHEFRDHHKFRDHDEFRNHQEFTGRRQFGEHPEFGERHEYAEHHGFREHYGEFGHHHRRFERNHDRDHDYSG